MPPQPTNAFVLRQSPSGFPALERISLPQNVIVNGWSEARGLIEESDYGRFREILKKGCYPTDGGYRRAGYAAATMWRFLKTMKVGDWVVVPHWGGVFYVAEVTGDPVYVDSPEAHKGDSCYRRNVRWLNDAHPISRKVAKAALVSRMKTQQTSAEAKDLIGLIAEALEAARTGKTSIAFGDDLRQALIRQTLAKIHDGHMSERRFEELVAAYLKAEGVSDVTIRARQNDKGADIVGMVSLAGVSELRLGVQVKWHRGETGKEAVDQLVAALEAEGLDLAWVISAASFSKEAHVAKEQVQQNKGFTVELVSGEEFAALLVDSGLRWI